MNSDFFIYRSPVGLYRIEYLGSVITRLYLTDMDEESLSTPFTREVERQLTEYFEGRRTTFSLEYKISSTPFQLKVYEVLLTIPYGETRTYKEIASAIGNPKASRAVGMANNRNPIAILIPCHRVIGSNGSLTGYAGGLGVKESLLRLERG